MLTQNNVPSPHGRIVQPYFGTLVVLDRGRAYPSRDSIVEA